MGSRGSGGRQAPRKPDIRGSSRTFRQGRSDRGESRSFRGLGLVQGSPKGWNIPRKALAGLLGSYLAALGQPRAQVTLLLCTARESKELNRSFRKRDKATDVLSFPSLDRRPPKAFQGYLGDLALCLDYAWKNKGRFAPDFGAECAFLVLHGLLHLNGKHHDTAAQERSLWALSRRLHPLHLPWAKALKRLKPKA